MRGVAGLALVLGGLGLMYAIYRGAIPPPPK